MKELTIPRVFSAIRLTGIENHSDHHPNDPYMKSIAANLNEKLSKSFRTRGNNFGIDFFKDPHYRSPSNYFRMRGKSVRELVECLREVWSPMITQSLFRIYLHRRKWRGGSHRAQCGKLNTYVRFLSNMLSHMRLSLPPHLYVCVHIYIWIIALFVSIMIPATQIFQVFCTISYHGASKTQNWCGRPWPYG